MKKASRSDETPDHIDFTKGVRGKYVDRYREGVSIRELPTTDPIAFYETQSRLGHALWQAQALEAAFVVYFSLVQDMAVQEAGTCVHDLLEHRASPATTFKHSLASLDEAFASPLRDRLQRFLPERNWLVHRSRFELEEWAHSHDRKYDITVRLQGLADEAQYLTLQLFQVLELKLSRRGLTPSDIEAQTKRVIDQWAAA